MELSPFQDLKITPSEFLDELTARELCSHCHKSRKYFCYTCFTVLPSIANKVPRIKLPFKVHIIKHRQEVSGKSTAIHAAVLAPDDVTIFQFPDIPDYEDSANTVLLSPGATAVSLHDYCASRSAVARDTTEGCSENAPLTVVFIDSTWFQVNSIVSDPRVAKLSRVELARHETKFWRHQLDKPPTYLSTIEAIYYTAHDYHCLLHERGGEEYSGQYDNLLFFFVYFYIKIRTVAGKTGKVIKAYDCQRKVKAKRK